MTKRTKETQKKETPRDRFLASLALGNSVSLSAQAAGVTRSHMYRLREKDEEFAEAWDAAIEDGTDVLEDEARRRAYVGTDKPVTYQGAITETYKEYSDTLLIFLLKARRPDKYRERSQHELTGPDGKPLPAGPAFNLVLNVGPASSAGSD